MSTSIGIMCIIRGKRKSVQCAGESEREKDLLDKYSFRQLKPYLCPGLPPRGLAGGQPWAADITHLRILVGEYSAFLFL